MSQIDNNKCNLCGIPCTTNTCPMCLAESAHVWSGWPGAFCLRCGAEDNREICLADGHDIECTNPECQNTPCPAKLRKE